MTLQNEPTGEPGGPGREPRPRNTTAQLKGDIDSGREGDKIGGFDPAASPLGTDEEASGVRPDPALVARDRRQEDATRASTAHENAASPELQPDGQGVRTPYVIPILIGVAAAVVLAVIVAALL
jgi:hypothetical protein